MKVEISKEEFPRYKGLREQIPGHLYMDNKGEKILFLGRGRYARISDDNKSEWNWHTRENMFLYMKWDNMQKKIREKRLAQDLSVYDPLASCKPCFWKTVFFSENPRVLVQDLGEVYPDTYFKYLEIEDKSYLYPHGGLGWPVHWEITTH